MNNNLKKAFDYYFKIPTNHQFTIIKSQLRHKKIDFECVNPGRILICTTGSDDPLVFLKCRSVEMQRVFILQEKAFIIQLTIPACRSLTQFLSLQMGQLRKKQHLYLAVPKESWEERFVIEEQQELLDGDDESSVGTQEC